MVIHIEDKKVRELLFCGQFGLERENLRVTGDGYLAKTKHPFPEHPHITMDFAENQMEINTPVFATAPEAIASLTSYSDEAKEALANQAKKEYLWPFSNPPYLEGEQDIPIAQFADDQAWKTTYREYLSDRYGRYKMTYCGTHVNYSFAEELLQADYTAYLKETQKIQEAQCAQNDPELKETMEGAAVQDFLTYKNRIYLDLAARAVKYSWLLTALTAASPLTDASFTDPGRQGGAVFTGLASMRCGEGGYWNSFTPIFEYDSMQAYTSRIRYYVEMGLIVSPSELYYPVRLKPSGSYDLDRLSEEGADHIELRMFDLNPLSEEGIEQKDLRFAQLLLIYLAAAEEALPEPKDQIQAVQNMKNAACYDLEKIQIVMPGKAPEKLIKAGRDVISNMRTFYEEYTADARVLTEIEAILDFEEEKLNDPGKRYAHIVREKMGGAYVKNGCDMLLQKKI